MQSHKILSDHPLPGLHGKPVLLDVFCAPDRVAAPVVVFSHGFKGFKDWGHYNALGERFAEEGFIFVKFNFSHNGTTIGHPDEITDLDAFGKNNYIIELDDLKCVLDFVHQHPVITQRSRHDATFLIGHSRGGATSILKAHEDARVKKLVTWAAVNDLTTIKKRTAETWKRDGVVYAKNARTGQELPMFRQFYDTVLKNTSRLNVMRAARTLTQPWLIVHGDADEAVPVGQAHQLSAANPAARLVIIDGSGHTFGVSHPFTGARLPDAAEKVVRETLAFLGP